MLHALGVLWQSRYCPAVPILLELWVLFLVHTPIQVGLALLPGHGGTLLDQLATSSVHLSFHRHLVHAGVGVRICLLNLSHLAAHVANSRGGEPLRPHLAVLAHARRERHRLTGEASSSARTGAQHHHAAPGAAGHALHGTTAAQHHAVHVLHHGIHLPEHAAHQATATTSEHAERAHHHAAALTERILLRTEGLHLLLLLLLLMRQRCHRRSVPEASGKRRGTAGVGTWPQHRIHAL
mmetsp:Transcript_66485/g.168471  ORF Transcript_66485/g.168471 Transcript_66485/m.168471 type:complete len:238 (+) Transcript_66485:259-972(+)